MSIFSNRRFKFSADKTIIALLAAGLCYSMSYWQWTRFEEKKLYFATLERQAQKTITPLDISAESWEDKYYGKFSVDGSFDFDREMVLINRSKDEVMGVRVVTPLRLENSDQAILVDRGFLPYDDYAKKRVDLFQYLNETHIEGLLRPTQNKTFFLAPDPKLPADGTWKARWLRLDVEKMATQIPYPVLPVVLEQTNQIGDFPQFDAKEVTKPGRHLNYTFQWLGFGTFAILLALFLQFRPIKPRLDSE